jgi:hypothetical protein
VLQFEIDSKGQNFPKDIQEVFNYVGAMNYGLDRLKRTRGTHCFSFSCRFFTLSLEACVFNKFPYRNRAAL